MPKLIDVEETVIVDKSPLEMHYRIPEDCKGLPKRLRYLWAQLQHAYRETKGPGSLVDVRGHGRYAGRNCYQWIPRSEDDE